MIEPALKELEIFNQITFVESVHKYYINNEPSAPVSVTGFISKFKPKFDEDKWARIKAKKLGISVDEMKFIWSEKNLFSTTLGTCFHKIAESIYTGVKYHINKNELQASLGDSLYEDLKVLLPVFVEQFKIFYNNTKNILEPIKNELVIGDLNNTRICGTMDMLVYNNRSKQYEIYDFKTNKDITYSSTYKERYSIPLDALEVCEYNTYSLQLSFYKYIIEQYTNLKIGALYIVWFDRIKNKPEIIDVKDYTGYVEMLLDRYKSTELLAR
jgi:hypothetical protein